jgi:hypothetical protein
MYAVPNLTFGTAKYSNNSVVLFGLTNII